MDANAFATLALLLGLELVLGIDNILVISILASRLPPERRTLARNLGLGIALVARLLMLGLAAWLTNLVQPVVLDLSVRDLVLLAGGLFLIYKAVKEIHHTVELHEHAPHPSAGPAHGFGSVIAQIVLLDVVFGLDSVITAVGLTDNFVIITISVLAAYIGLLFFAGPVGDYILKRPALKILALSFLVTIGVTLFMEGLHQEVPKAYIYLPMGFALVVELLQMRQARNESLRQIHPRPSADHPSPH